MQGGGNPINCGTCWKNMPPVTLIYLIITGPVSLALVISCLALSSKFNCYIFGYLSLTPYQIYQKGEVWRFFTPYFVNNSFWSIIYVLLGFFFSSVVLEKAMGSKRFGIMLAICLILNSLLCTAFQAFFGLIPGINSVTYFYNQWYDYTPIGSMPILILIQILDIRAHKRKQMMCCCFQMPVWLYIILLVVMAQLMMYPIWYGIFYNISAIIIAFAVPMKYLQVREQLPLTNAPGQAYDQNAAGRAVAPAGGDNFQFTTMNGAPTAQEKKKEAKANKNESQWGKGGKKL
ncbi:Conserved_hypothetical protein [Hexamita inflata]|uniref:Peptidase S54 rhomboid domain-containing protein n=1 Tax=Hexamita inflata TaxID=28002 RepID=A0AA86REA5_9EUKA|nr:Conserved hypothetical protein [Hexamita inflata]